METEPTETKDDVFTRKPPVIIEQNIKIAWRVYMTPFLAAIFSIWVCRIATQLFAITPNYWLVLLFLLAMFVANASAKEHKSFGWWITGFLVFGEVLIVIKEFAIGFFSAFQ